MDNEMIERVIKASFDCWKEDKGKSHFIVEYLSSSEYTFAVKHAKAVIKAMREPTEKMLDNGHIKADWNAKETINLIYTTMINAILND